MWKDSTHFGVGIATMPARKYGNYGNKETFIVAMYSPQGNFYYIGKKVEAYTANVKPRNDRCKGSNCKFFLCIFFNNNFIRQKKVGKINDKIF